MGMAASMGQTLLHAGTRGKRYALRRARVMMHQPHGGNRDAWFTAGQARGHGFVDHVIDSTDRAGT
ncbi:hypothetical protein ETD83_36260 [Actinomadura soli]|uniref:ATP-dependent Clp protease proteolytic subunit n=2 Tax=Actinomadura soli TaxID=2508997 RepID=A0A5C4J0S7_9ACTN|nr:hypothetical protein ETD83_36260 [Actinomadura soli]